jgi:hypothetical protein
MNDSSSLIFLSFSGVACLVGSISTFFVGNQVANDINMIKTATPITVAGAIKSSSSSPSAYKLIGEMYSNDAVLCGLKQQSLICKSKLERIFETEKNGINWFGSQTLGSVRMSVRNIIIKDKSSVSSSSLKLPYDWIKKSKYFTLNKVADIFTPISPVSAAATTTTSNTSITTLMGFRQQGFAAFNGDPILIIGKFVCKPEQAVNSINNKLSSSSPSQFLFPEPATHYRISPTTDDKLIITTMSEHDLLSHLSKRELVCKIISLSLLCIGMYLIAKSIYVVYKKRKESEEAELRFLLLLLLLCFIYCK